MLNMQGLRKTAEIIGDDFNDRRLLRQMAKTASSYISAFKWCPPIHEIYLAEGIGGVIAIFLVEFTESIQDTEDKLWVIVGDVPSVYMVVEPNDDAAQALARYCELMEDWALAVENATDLSDVFPIAAEPTRENADLLLRRIKFIRTEIIPRADRRGDPHRSG